jgi:hypothetical protein
MRDIKAMIDYQAKRNPVLCSMLDNIDDYTKEEIEAERFPKWIRLHLFRMKDDTAFRARLEDSGVFDRIVQTTVPDTNGLVYQWTGADFWVKISGNRGDVFMRSGDLVFYPETGGMWINTLYSSTIDPRLRTAQRIGKRSKSEYGRDFQDMLQDRYRAHNLPTIDLTGSAPSGVAPGASANMGVTASGIAFQIGRH